MKANADGNSEDFYVDDPNADPNSGQGGLLWIKGLQDVEKIRLTLTDSDLGPNDQSDDFILFNVATQLLSPAASLSWVQGSSYWAVFCGGALSAELPTLLLILLRMQLCGAVALLSLTTATTCYVLEVIMKSRTNTTKSPSLILRGSMNKLAQLLLLVFTCIAFAGLSAAQTPPPSNQQLSAEELQRLDDWHVAIAQVPAPGKGCFETTYPSLEWHKVGCVAPSNLHFLPKQGA